MRFPGQYFDNETNLHYNYFRDYDPDSGRYVESDPVGLEAGLNTYSYVGSRPLLLRDSSGLDATVVFYPGGVTHIGIGINTSNTVGFYPAQKSLDAAICRDVPGVVMNDLPRQQSALPKAQSVTIKTNELQDMRMQQYINRFRQGSTPTPSYNLCSMQCTSFVAQVLQAGGVPIPGGDFTVPSKLFDSLNTTYGQPGGSK